MPEFTATAPVISRLLCSATLAMLILLVAPAHAENHQDSYTRCLVNQLQTASDSDNVGTLRDACKEFIEKVSDAVDAPPVADPGLFERRMILEKETSQNRFAITQHRGSYILPLTYNNKTNSAPFQEVDENTELDDTEVKFQISLKAQLFDSILNDRGRVYFGYTNQSHWQLYNRDNSSPFRETNHEPELFLDLDQDFDLAGWHIPLVRMGVVHQSNGRSVPLSRSWNRAYAELFLEKGKYAASFKPWILIPSGSTEEDNPDIDDYMGNFELRFYRQGNTSATSLMLRNNLRSDNHGAVEFNWSTPVPYNKKLRFLFQYFYGYGESLIDYNVLTNRIGIGLQLSDFL